MEAGGNPIHRNIIGDDEIMEIPKKMVIDAINEVKHIDEEDLQPLIDEKIQSEIDQALETICDKYNIYVDYAWDYLD